MSAPRSPAPIAPTDRVSEVLARDESLVEVFVRCAPHFAKLRNRAMRRVMARLVTVEQAARMADVPVAALLRDLNDALGVSGTQAGATGGPRAEAMRVVDGRRASAEESARRPDGARVVELDVRDDLRLGREPFSKIMAAVAALANGEVLRLRAIFEPVPLFSALERRGFAHAVRCDAPDDWSVWFWRPAAPRGARRARGASDPGARDVPVAEMADPANAEAASGAAARGPGKPPTTWLDVRGLEPPEPMVRTLAALESLPPGHALVQVNQRVPQFLLPVLAERGYVWRVDESYADRVLVHIWRVA